MSNNTSNAPSSSSRFTSNIPEISLDTENSKMNGGSTSLGAKSRFITKDEEDAAGSMNSNNDTSTRDDEKVKTVPFLSRMKLFFCNQLSIGLLNLRRNHKLCGYLLDKFDRLSPTYRKFAICLVVMWKFFTTGLTIYLVLYSRSKFLLHNKNEQSSKVVYGGEDRELATGQQQEQQAGESKFRVLHIITSLAEYNSGLRATDIGQDRLQEILIPCMKGAVNSIMKEPNWSVDVYLILGFNLSSKRRQLVQNALPKGIGLEVWSDATPFEYDSGNRKGPINVVRPITRGLARQHRYVILDKLNNYDFFTAFEDDMRIASSHIKAFVELSDKIDLLKRNAKEKVGVHGKQDKSISGSLTVTQWERVIPGFFRVEVLREGSMSQVDKDPTIVDLDFDGINQTVNPDYCCAVPKSEQHPGKILLPTNPKPNHLMTWETAIASFALRKFPEPIGWAGLLPGRKKLEPGQVIGSYWSGEDGSLGARKGAGEGKLFGQQGGFMASRQQIIEFDRLCPDSGFLPPFDDPQFVNEGLHMKNVEFWSGGYQLFGGGLGGCNFQRILPIDPDGFSKFLLYHTANNKQTQIHRGRHLLVENLLGQINSIKKIAENKLTSNTT